jgi:hypothetical protein
VKHTEKLRNLARPKRFELLTPRFVVSGPCNRRVSLCRKPHAHTAALQGFDCSCSRSASHALRSSIRQWFRRPPSFMGLGLISAERSTSCSHCRVAREPEARLRTSPGEVWSFARTDLSPQFCGSKGQPCNWRATGSSAPGYSDWEGCPGYYGPSSKSGVYLACNTMSLGARMHFSRAAICKFGCRRQGL